MTELVHVSAGVGDLSFHYFYGYDSLSPIFSSDLFVTFLMTGEPAHTASKKEWGHTLCVHLDEYLNYQLCTVKKPFIITLHFQLSSACYTVLQMKNITRSIYAINPVTTDSFHYRHTLGKLNMKWDTKEDKRNCVHYTYCGMSKGTCRDEKTSSGEKLNSIHLAINELCLPEGIKQLVDQSVEINIVQSSVAIYWKHFWLLHRDIRVKVKVVRLTLGGCSLPLSNWTF